MLAQSNIYLVGMMGCGKTTVGRALAEQLGRRFYDSDEEIIRLSGRSVTAIFEQEGEGVFRHQEGRVIRGLSAMQNIVAALGGGALTREINQARLNISGKIVWLDFPAEVLLKRIGDDNSRPLLKGLDKAGKLEALEKLLERRRYTYSKAHIHMKFSGDASIPSIVQDLIKKL